MSLPQVVSRDEWLAARVELLAKEKEATRARDTLNTQRRRLPMVRIEKDYLFDGPDGKKTLLDLFDGRRQLIIYHFMFDPSWDEGCPSCSLLVDNLGHLAHLHARDTSLAVVSRAPRSKIEPFKERMGWSVPWFSSYGSDFNYDFHVTIDPAVLPAEYNYVPSDDSWTGEVPGTSVFLREGDQVFHTYSSYARGGDILLGTYNYLDLTPLGRQEDWEQPPGRSDGPFMSWVRRHDEYGANRTTADRAGDDRVERIVCANGVDLCAATFGDPADPPILLIGNSMLTWHDDLCERLAAGGRFVLRYDLRDTGRSTTVDPDAPRYTLRDLVADAAGLLDALDLPHAHVVGFGVGGWIAQLMSLDYPDRVVSLTLIATRPTAPGPNDPDLPEHSPELMSYLMGAPEPDWSDRAAVVDYMTESGRHFAGSQGFDEAEVREQARRIFDRTVDAAPDKADPRKIHRANQIASVFAALDTGDRWRERLGEITVPTLVIHGDEDPFFPVGNAEALANEIPGSELLTLPKTGQELPRRVWDVVVAAVLRYSSAG